jgi:hypothetical protein
LEERVRERRPFTLLDAAVGADIPAGCRASIPGVLAENDDLLSLALSSRGGEGTATAASDHRDACKVPVRATGELRFVRLSFIQSPCC